jgi:hypothetical protein
MTTVSDEDAPGFVRNWLGPHKSLKATLAEIWDSRNTDPEESEDGS